MSIPAAAFLMCRLVMSSIRPGFLRTAKGDVTDYDAATAVKSYIALCSNEALAASVYRILQG